MSLKMCCFASGSKGNCCYVSDGETELLIDMGISATRVENALRVLGASADRAEIFLTHSHSDHINGLKVFCKRHSGASVHCQSESVAAVRYHTGINPVVDGRVTRVGGITVTAIPVPHDVPCFGYIVSSGAFKVAVVTDIGEIDADTLNSLVGCNIVMLEANHDIAMLRANRNYTPELKARILSPHGHLSNPDCARACAYLAENGVKNFILAHLSEENNRASIASREVVSAIECAGITDARVVTAAQNSPTGLFEIC